MDTVIGPIQYFSLGWAYYELSDYIADGNDWIVVGMTSGMAALIYISLYVSKRYSR